MPKSVTATSLLISIRGSIDHETTKTFYTVYTVPSAAALTSVEKSDEKFPAAGVENSTLFSSCEATVGVSTLMALM